MTAGELVEGDRMVVSADRQVPSELIALAHRLADSARMMTLPRFREPGEVCSKSQHGFDPVTEADRAAERCMREMIVRERPDDGISGEEYEPVPTKNGYTWVLDPIDGTRAFISGVPVWGTLVALLRDDYPILGVVDQPYLDERYWGLAGGAWIRDRFGQRPIQTRLCLDMAGAILSTTTPAVFDRNEIEAFKELGARVRLVRYGCDCYAYALLAAGLIDLVVETALEPFDILSPIALVTAAGGLVTDWNGNSAGKGGQCIAAGDPRIHAEALELLRCVAKV